MTRAVALALAPLAAVVLAGCASGATVSPSGPAAAGDPFCEAYGSVWIPALTERNSVERQSEEYWALYGFGRTGEDSAVVAELHAFGDRYVAAVAAYGDALDALEAQVTESETRASLAQLRADNDSLFSSMADVYVGATSVSDYAERAGEVLGGDDAMGAMSAAQPAARELTKYASARCA